LLRRKKRIELEVTPATFETLALGTVAGLRSMAAPALLSRAIRRGDLKAPNFPALGSPKVSTTLTLLMIGEMIGDKTPFVPSRTSAPALLVRLLSGALAGATLFASEGHNKNSGAILGALCAAATAYGGERLRAAAAQKLQLPDLILAGLEDRFVLSLGKRALRKGS
jgi:uncharacterized membrane protein